MKKLFFVAFAISLVSFSIAQKPEAVVEKFRKVTGLDKFETAKSTYMEVELSVQQMTIPMNITTQGSNKSRIEIEVMGTQLVMIKVDSTVWTIAAGQVEKKSLKESNFDQQDVSKMFDFKGKPLKYIRKEKNYEIIEYLENPTDKEPGSLYFNTTTGLLDKIIINRMGANATINLTKYQDFNGVKLPSSLEINAETVTTYMTIKRVELDYPIAGWMFAAPSN